MVIASISKVGGLGFNSQWLPKHFFSELVPMLIYHQLLYQQVLPPAISIVTKSCTCTYKNARVFHPLCGHYEGQSCQHIIIGLPYVAVSAVVVFHNEFMGVLCCNAQVIESSDLCNVETFQMGCLHLRT